MTRRQYACRLVLAMVCGIARVPTRVPDAAPDVAVSKACKAAIDLLASARSRDQAHQISLHRFQHEAVDRGRATKVDTGAGR